MKLKMKFHNMVILSGSHHKPLFGARARSDTFKAFS